MMRAFLLTTALAVAASLSSAAGAADTPSTAEARKMMNEEVLLKLYPRRAMAAGEQGLVGFVVKLDREGEPTECKVTHSSGHRLLDEETCSLIVAHAKFKAIKNEDGERWGSTHEGVVNWRLPASSANVRTPVALANADANSRKVICKKSATIGSLVARERTCMTRREWVRSADDSKEAWIDLQGTKGTTNGR